MRIIVWSHNNEPKYREQVAAFCQNYFPSLQVVYRNPMFFSAADIEKADIIICKTEWPEVLNGYKALRDNPDIPYNPRIIENISQVPKFKIVPVEEENPEENLDSPDLDFTPKAPTPEEHLGVEEVEESGTLSAALQEVLSGQEEELPISTDTGTPAEPVEVKTAAKPKAKAKAKEKPKAKPKAK